MKTNWEVLKLLDCDFISYVCSCEDSIFKNAYEYEVIRSDLTVQEALKLSHILNKLNGIKIISSPLTIQSLKR